MKDITDYFVKKAPPKIHYIPNFLTEEQETYLIDRILNVPKPKWEVLSNRRLQNWGGVVSKSTLIPADDIPNWLQFYVDEICELADVFPDSNLPNHILLNEYLPGQGIMPHLDGALYYPIVTTITVGSHGLLKFYKPLYEGENDSQKSWEEREVGGLLLERRSLVVIQEDMYNKYLHGIEGKFEDVVLNDKIFNLEFCCIGDGSTLKRETRYSLTIRNIPKVAKFNVMSLIKK